jgi:NTE family protein
MPGTFRRDLVCLAANAPLAAILAIVRIALCLSVILGLLAADVVGAMDAARPRVGLVLSGGGARGGAHVGVLKVLEAERIPIDAIAGTSMGAVVGGLYASGLSAGEIATLIESREWREAFREPAPRDRLSFRRKAEDQNFLVKFPVGLNAGSFRLPKSLISGQRINQVLRKATLPVGTVTDFDALHTPFRAMATDLESGEAVELKQGDLVTALRASLAAPGVFEPVEVEGKLLVDGGLANNLPVDVARAMGVDILIVVDVGFPLRKRDSLDSVATISNQMLSILIRRGSDAQRRALSPRDILLAPELGEASSFDFEVFARAAVEGETTASAALERLRPLAVASDDYAAYVAGRKTRHSAPSEVKDVRVAADSQRYSRLIKAAFELDPGALSVSSTGEQAAAFDAALTTLYGRGNFERVDYRVLPPANSTIEVSATRNSWGPNYVRFGLSLQDDFSGNSSYNAAARFVLADIGSLAAEWVWDFQIGSEPKVATQWYVPFGDTARWFVMPEARFDARNVPVLADDRRIAEYRLRTTEYGIDIGREIGNVAEARVGVRRVTGHTRLRLGNPVPGTETDFDVREWFGRFSYDALDNRNFPRRGQYLLAEWRGERTDLGSDGSADLLSVDGLIARSRGRDTGVAWVSFGTSADSQSGSVRALFPLGGFLNLSGLAPDSISGRHFAIARLMYYRQIGRGGEGFLNVPAYAGLSLEAGNVWDRRSAISLGSARKQGSVFFGFDTLFGPVYLGTGFGEDRTAFYLFLGRTF